MGSDRPRPSLSGEIVLLAATILAAATPTAAAASGSARGDALVLPRAEIPEERLVDVAIDLFSPGVGPAMAASGPQKGVRAVVRRSEARYIPIQLRNTLQSTGQWGAVRVVPGGSGWAELLLTGTIEKSNGRDLQVHVSARDAAGRVWLDKDYKERADTTAYAKDRPLDGRDPFQALYNRLANDLVRARDKRRTRELAEVHDLARLRFAASLAPEPYGRYFAVGKGGRARVERLPAPDDPMIARVTAIRERDHMFVDTLNEHYSDFHARMDKAYDDWRAYSYTEQLALDSIRRKSNLKKILGGIAVIGGLLMDPTEDMGMKDVLIIGGIAAVQSGFENAKEMGIHRAALSELTDSFENEVTPLVVDVDGKVVQLSGSAEQQFTQWREILEQIASTDQPLPADINLAPMAPGEVVHP